MPDSEIRMPLEWFQRHFVLTHRKDAAVEVFDEVRRVSEQTGRPFGDVLAEWMRTNHSQTAYHDNNWYAREIPISGCYFAHTDFRGWPVPKNQRFVDFLPHQRAAIESGKFPCSAEIHAAWLGPMPEPMIQEREPEKYFVRDGQLRVIRHWYHRVENLRVIIYRGKLDV